MKYYDFKLDGINIIGDHPIYSFYLGKLPSNIYNLVKQEVNSFKSEKKLSGFQHLLEGHIDHEYAFDMPLKVEDYLIDRCKDYLSVPSLKKLPSMYVSRFSEKIEELNLVKKNSAWINFQGKYEYNPLHHHGGFLSYVIWYQIPYRKEDEDKFGPGKLKSKNENSAQHNGNFYFMKCSRGNAEMVDLPVDKSWEGKFAIFPSELQHGVNPFYTSDEYRITISNNYFLNIN